MAKEKNFIEPLTVEFPQDGMNTVVAKVNELVEHLNK